MLRRQWRCGLALWLLRVLLSLPVVGAQASGTELPVEPLPGLPVAGLYAAGVHAARVQAAGVQTSSAQASGILAQGVLVPVDAQSSVLEMESQPDDARSDEALPVASSVAAAVSPVETTATEDAESGESDPSVTILSGCIRRDDEGRFAGWVDYQHCVFSGRSMASARWVDDLFGDWSEDDASLLVRVIAETGWDEETGSVVAARVRGSVDLPNALTRLRLVISDESEGEAGTTALPDVARELRSNAAVALRWIPFFSEGFRTDVDVGTRSGPEIYTRLRLRKVWSLDNDSLLRAGQTLTNGSDRGAESVSQLGIERALSEHYVLGIDTVWRLREAETAPGFSWSHGVSLLRAVGDAGALSYGASVAGHTRPSFQRDNHGIWLRWRQQSAWRDWLFYEVEPRLTAYHDLGRDVVPSLTLRLEMQFGQYGKK